MKLRTVGTTRSELGPFMPLGHDADLKGRGDITAFAETAKWGAAPLAEK